MKISVAISLTLFMIITSSVLGAGLIKSEENRQEEGNFIALNTQIVPGSGNQGNAESGNGQNANNGNGDASGVNNASGAETNQDNSSLLTRELVAQHNTKKDCWMIMDNGVYAISAYFGMHPGGDAIIVPYCGADGTQAFSTKGKKNPSDHSKFAYDLLSKYYIGDLSTKVSNASTQTVSQTNTANNEPESSTVTTTETTPNTEESNNDATEPEEEVETEPVSVSYISKIVVNQVEMENIGELIYRIELRDDMDFSVWYILDNKHYEAIVDGTGEIINTLARGSISDDYVLRDIAIHNYVMNLNNIITKINNTYVNAKIYMIDPKISHHYKIKFYNNNKKIEALVDSNGVIQSEMEI